MRYLVENWHKFVFVAIMFALYGLAVNWYYSTTQVDRTNEALGQLGKHGELVQQRIQQQEAITSNAVFLGFFGVLLLTGFVFLGDIRRAIKQGTPAAVALLVLFSTGCYRPFQPVKLEAIKPNEEAFLLPLTGDIDKQTSSNNEEYLKKNLVYTQQVQIPQQWVPKGFETWGPNGAWHDAAILVRVEKSPVSREWTADPNSGTSNKNEAIWVMTSDQVEFSTGWIITARIENRDDAVKFLHNYPNGSLTTVLDTEVRGKLQAEFGIEVTDLPMERLRKQATPHIEKTVKKVTEFFKPRGISITNLGISGGFIYKDKSIIDTLVKSFNAEQQKAIATSEAAAQEERNKAVIFEATGKADAILKTKKAEADGIKMLADAKFYEIEKSKENLAAYVQLKQLELQRELLLKWDGRYPQYFMGGGAGATPNLLLQVPQLDGTKK